MTNIRYVQIQNTTLSFTRCSHTQINCIVIIFAYYVVKGGFDTFLLLSFSQLIITNLCLILLSKQINLYQFLILAVVAACVEALFTLLALLYQVRLVSLNLTKNLVRCMSKRFIICNCNTSSVVF